MMNLAGNRRLLRAWTRAMKYGYFTSAYWAKYHYLAQEHHYRANLWMDRELARVG